VDDGDGDDREDAEWERLLGLAAASGIGISVDSDSGSECVAQIGEHVSLGRDYQIANLTKPQMKAFKKECQVHLDERAIREATPEEVRDYGRPLPCFFFHKWNMSKSSDKFRMVTLGCRERNSNFANADMGCSVAAGFSLGFSLVFYNDPTDCERSCKAKGVTAYDVEDADTAVQHAVKLWKGKGKATSWSPIKDTEGAQ